MLFANIFLLVLNQSKCYMRKLNHYDCNTRRGFATANRKAGSAPAEHLAGLYCIISCGGDRAQTQAGGSGGGIFCGENARKSPQSGRATPTGRGTGRTSKPAETPEKARRAGEPRRRGGAQGGTRDAATLGRLGHIFFLPDWV